MNAEKIAEFKRRAYETYNQPVSSVSSLDNRPTRHDALMDLFDELVAEIESETETIER